MQHVEAHPRAAGARIQAHRQRDEAESQISRPDGSRHGTLLLGLGELSCRMRYDLPLWPGCERVVYTRFAKQVSGHGFSRAEKRITLNCHPERSGREPAAAGGLTA